MQNDEVHWLVKCISVAGASLFLGFIPTVIISTTILHRESIPTFLANISMFVGISLAIVFGLMFLVSCMNFLAKNTFSILRHSVDKLYDIVCHYCERFF